MIEAYKIPPELEQVDPIAGGGVLSKNSVGSPTVIDRQFGSGQVKRKAMQN